MILFLSWCLFGLGVAHILMGLVKHRRPIAQAVSEGLFGKFAGIDERRIAFWFTIFGVLLTMAGHVAVDAAGAGNLALVRLVAGYVLAVAAIGTAALPKSPFPLALGVAAALLAATF